jgi:hypothetical protein
MDDSFETSYIKYFVLLVGSGAILALILAVLLDDSGDYSLITKDTEVSGWVSNVDRQHGMLFFNIDDTAKYKVNGHMSNYAYSQESFFSFLGGGDWIEKKKGTDTLLVRREMTATRETKYYIFVLGKELNGELKKPGN